MEKTYTRKSDNTLWTLDQIKEYFVSSFQKEGKPYDATIEHRINCSLYEKYGIPEGPENEAVHIAVKAAGSIQQTTETPEAFSASLAALCDEFDAVGGVIGLELMDAVEHFFKSKLRDSDIDRLNDSLRAKGKRKLSYSDYARIYIIHRRNITKNPGGEAPFAGVIAWSEKAAEEGMMDTGYDVAHCSLAISTLFDKKLNLLRETAPATWNSGKGKESKCRAYTLLPSPELDPHF